MYICHCHRCTERNIEKNCSVSSSVVAIKLPCTNVSQLECMLITPNGTGKKCNSSIGAFSNPELHTAPLLWKMKKDVAWAPSDSRSWSSHCFVYQSVYDINVWEKHVGFNWHTSRILLRRFANSMCDTRATFCCTLLASYLLRES